MYKTELFNLPDTVRSERGTLHVAPRNVQYLTELAV